MSHSKPIPVIDVFAGPGGLGEGFASLRNTWGQPIFDIRLSIETDEFAHRTLLLRSFFRQFEYGTRPAAYYDYVRGHAGLSDKPVDHLLDRFPRAAEAARNHAWRATLGVTPQTEISERIEAALGPRSRRGPWVLVGGPPCQAYSLAGRSRMLPKLGAKFYADKRHTLYREYLRLLADHRPTVFVMENVKGLLSSKFKKEPIIEQILADLQEPRAGLRYELIPVVRRGLEERLFDHAVGHPPADFLIESERYGIPQMRHRVVVVGVLSRNARSTARRTPTLQDCYDRPTCWDAIGGLPRIRSGLSRELDTDENWKAALWAVETQPWMSFLQTNGGSDIADQMLWTLDNVRVPRQSRGARYVPGDITVECHAEWFLDARLAGACNHEGRSHMTSDLYRYLYAACFARARGVSPRLGDFPRALLPDHGNVRKALREGIFNDRFRVQLRDAPATTVTSHIAKDGHYFIHPDPTQCRSLTVREAARLQTFPDNYFFEGPRTEQYRQVGNAVPPLLAHQIADVVANLIG